MFIFQYKCFLQVGQNFFPNTLLNYYYLDMSFFCDFSDNCLEYFYHLLVEKKTARPSLWYNLFDNYLLLCLNKLFFFVCFYWMIKCNQDMHKCIRGINLYTHVWYIEIVQYLFFLSFFLLIWIPWPDSMLIIGWFFQAQNSNYPVTKLCP